MEGQGGLAVDGIVNLVTVVGLGVAVVLAALYALLRAISWFPGRRDPVQAARSHGTVTALVALFASGPAAYTRLFTVDGTVPLVPESQAQTTRVHPSGALQTVVTGTPEPLGWAQATTIISGPVVALVAVYLVAQYTWPRPTGVVRTARLSGHRARNYLPRSLTAVTAVVALWALACVLLAFSTPAVPVRLNSESLEEAPGYLQDSWTDPGYRAGDEFAPWLLAALGLTLLGTSLVIAVVARRPPLTGLHPGDDDAVRHIAVNRALRTAVLMQAGIASAAATAWGNAQQEAARRARDRRLETAADTSVAWQDLAPPMIPYLTPILVMVGVILAAAMLLWRSRYVHELGGHTDVGRDGVGLPGAPGADTAPGRPPARPGTVHAVARIRSDALVVIWVVAVAFVGLISLWLVELNLGPEAGAGSTAVSAEDEWAGATMLWAGLPFLTATLILCASEILVRRRHAVPAGTAPVITGRASPWTGWALGLAVVLALPWCALCLLTVVPQSQTSAGLAAGVVVLGLAGWGGARLALHRPALAQATATQDATVRQYGADRFRAAAAAGIYTMNAVACLQAVQVWHGFTGSAGLDPGVEELPPVISVVRTVTVVVLLVAAAACLALPALADPGAAADRLLAEEESGGTDRTVPVQSERPGGSGRPGNPGRSDGSASPGPATGSVSLD